VWGVGWGDQVAARRRIHTSVPISSGAFMMDHIDIWDLSSAAPSGPHMLPTSSIWALLLVGRLWWRYAQVNEHHGELEKNL